VVGGSGRRLDLPDLLIEAIALGRQDRDACVETRMSGTSAVAAVGCITEGCRFDRLSQRGHPRE